MPFDYKEYQKKCDSLTVDQLQAEYENYTRQLAGGATSTATSVLFSPFTAGISLVGIGLSAPRVHNARKKREIIEAGLQARGETHRTRKRDVLAPVAVAGTLSGLTLGLAGPGADMVAGQAVGHGMEYAASHVALDASGAIIEHKHDKRTHQKAHQKLQTPHQYQAYQQPGFVNSQVSPNQPESTTKPPTSPAHSDPPPAYQLRPQYQKYESVTPTSPQQVSTIYPPTLHLQSDLQGAAVPQSHVYQPSTYILAEQTNTNSPSVSMLSELESSSVGIHLSNSQYSATHVQYTTGSDVHLESTPDKLDAKSEEPLHITVYELDSEPVVAVDEDPSGPVQLTMEQEIAFLKAKILEMEIEKREGANRAHASTDPGQPKATLHITAGQNGVSQFQLGPFEPELSITPALASLVEHQNFQMAPESPTHGVTSPGTPAPSCSLETQSLHLPPPPSPTQGVVSPVTPSLKFQAVDQLPTTSLYPAPLRLRSHSAHIPGYQYTAPSSLTPSVVSPITPSLQHHLEDSGPTKLFIPPPPPPRPHSTGIPGYQDPPPPPPSSSPSSSLLSPVTPPVPNSLNNSTSNTPFCPPPLPPRPHSAHIPEYQPSSPYSSISNGQQQQSYAVPRLPPRPQQQPQIQRQDSGYYSNPPSRHSSTFSTASVSTSCSSPQSMLSPQSTGVSFLSPQTTGQSLRHSVSYGSISPMSSQPTSYFPPPPPSPTARPLSQVKDYFNRSFARPTSQTLYQPGMIQPAQAPQQYQGSQGWQWGAAPIQPNLQPQYGTPPPIPNAWKRS